MLNDEQQAFVRSDASIIVAVAPPGTGKTEALCQRAILRVDDELRRTSLQRLAVITYTRNAAKELRARIPIRTGRLFIGTIHQFFIGEILGRFAGVSEQLPWAIGRVNPPSELNAEYRAAFLAFHGTNPPSGWGITLSEQRRRLLGGDKTLTHNQIEFLNFSAERMRSAGIWDYDRYIEEGVRLVQTDPMVTEVLRRLYWGIYIDEYQDLGVQLHAFVKSLTEPSTTIPAPELALVGDPNQAIMGFVGSHPRYMKEFIDRDGQGVDVHRFTTSYRSGHLIVGAARILLQVPNLDAAQLASGEIDIESFANPDAEAKWIAEDIRDRIDAGHRPEQIAVLFRYGTHAPPIAVALSRAGVRYSMSHTADGLREVDDGLTLVIAAIRSRGDDHASYRIRQACGSDLTPSAAIACADVARNADPGLLSSLLDGLLNVEDLPSRIRSDLVVLTDWSEVNISTGFTDLLDVAGVPEPGVVHLGTMHTGKGLGYETVYMARCNSNIFPGYFDRTADQKAEAKRLFFVSVTRAAKRLVVTFPLHERGRGQWHEHEASEFVDELGRAATALRAARPS